MQHVSLAFLVANLLPLHEPGLPRSTGEANLRQEVADEEVAPLAAALQWDDPEPAAVMVIAARPDPSSLARASKSTIPDTQARSTGWEIVSVGAVLSTSTVIEVEVSLPQPSMASTRSSCEPSVSVEVDQVQLRRHQHRYPSTGALADDLRRLLAGDPVAASS